MSSSPTPSEPDPMLKRARRRDRKVRLELLQKVMSDLGWQASDLVEKAGVSEQIVSRMFAGKYIRLSNAKAIQQAFAPYFRVPLFDSSVASPALATSVTPGLLETFQEACGRAAPGIQASIRVRESVDLIRERTSHFVGRDWLFQALDEFMAREAAGYFLLRGHPGVGKTSFAAALTSRHGCIHHFNSRLSGLNTTEQFLTNVCGQLIAAFDLPHAVLPPRSGCDSGYLLQLLTEAAGRSPAAKLLLVVDALDEAEGPIPLATNPLALPLRLPARTYMLLTTRETGLVPRMECPFRSVFLDQSSDGNLADIRRHLADAAARPLIQTVLRKQRVTTSEFMALLERKSQGNFMYLRYVIPEIEQGRYLQRQPEELPEGLANYYESHWRLMRSADRSAWFAAKLPILRALAAAPEAVTLGLLADRLPDISPAVIQDILEHDWRQFLATTSIAVGDRRVIAWRLYHASFADFLREKSADPAERFDLERERDLWFHYARQHGLTPD